MRGKKTASGKAKSKATTAKPASGPNVLKISEDESKSPERLLAEVGFSPCGANANTARAFAADFAGELHITDAIDVLRLKAARVQQGDMTEMEATLTAQAVALDAIFNGLAKRAALNMGQYMGACETYLRLALKAQAQCRATVETLVEIKYPKAATFVRQQNVAYQQQVNNGDAGSKTTSTRTHARTGENDCEQNKLLEDGSNGGTHLDTGTTTAAGGSDSTVEAVGAVNRAEKHGR
ncbi:hypothetical protein [Noviherbaspirillum sp.]|jgi:hypothetical protein|uniref:hypothetical protein n=1 Tax=Noviherbaspirillum sp. TaxID=1926288 RepID=UPI0025DF94BC|nr:hypothetical protein [Noviherbaspirillum sp.]